MLGVRADGDTAVMVRARCVIVVGLPISGDGLGYREPASVSRAAAAKSRQT